MLKKNNSIFPKAETLRNRSYLLSQNHIRYPVLTREQVLIKILNAYELKQTHVEIFHAYIYDTTLQELSEQGYNTLNQIDECGVPKCFISW